MRTSPRNIALLAGVSISALGLSAPALASTSVSPGIGHSDTSDPVSDTLVICNIGESCFFGVEATGEGVVAAIVDSVATGRIEQFGSSVSGDVDLAIVNEGDAQIAAHASATAGGFGFATASALIVDAVLQQGNAGDGDVTLDFTNAGTLIIDSIATAQASSAAMARADARINGGIVQAASADGDGSAALNFVNVGSLGISAIASAAGGSANANAGAASAIVQDAIVTGGAAAQAVIDNSGSLAINVAALAQGDLIATAFAANDGINQVASAFTEYAGTSAVTGGAEFFRVEQPLGPASAVIGNSGTIAIAALAQADAVDGYAAGFAAITGLAQSARGTDAEVAFGNDGGFQVVAVASANGANGVANANAAGIDQTASAVQAAQTTVYAATIPIAFESSRTPVGAAAASLQNNGTLSVIASGLASGGSALAGANVDGIDQFAAGTEALAALDNSGTIAIAAVAGANGGPLAEAAARADGITQIASALASEQRVEFSAAGTAFYELHTPVGPASAQFANDGEINIDASALAQATGAAFASAAASGLVQSAKGSDVQASVDNGGELIISALAQASGTAATALASAGGFIQQASAVETEAMLFTPISTGPTTGTITIFSHVSGSTFIPTGPASVQFENSGIFDVHAVALADGDDGGFAGVNLWGGTQSANGTSVDAALINSGDMTLGALASAIADTVAVASAYNNGFKQYANATSIIQNVVVPQTDGGVIVYNGQAPVGPAAGSIVNEGSIEITSVARAVAEGGLGTATTFAPGTVGYGTAYASGFGQFVWGTQATGSFENSGSLLVAADVEASGVDGAGAFAIALGVRQGVNTLGSTVADHYGPGGDYLDGEFNLYFAGPATISVVNDGVMTILAQAEAAASNGPASAAADARGFSMGISGTKALMDVANSGDLMVAAVAEASGTTGLASAIAAGMTQNVSTGLDLTIDVLNSGIIDIDASALAVQVNGATAIAAGIGVTERGKGIEEAHLSLDNSGTIEVDVVAVAQGGYFAGGTAYATGIGQRATSTNAELILDNSGTIDVAAGMQAVADAETGFAGATAFAHGYSGFATNALVDVENSGSIRAIATASAQGASGWALATAAGISVAAIGGTTSAPALGTLSAALINAGSITVVASAHGIDDSVDAFASTAFAAGIVLTGGAVSGSIENSGIIDVSAIVGSEAGIATASGIVILNNGQTSLGTDTVITITNNGGTIVARESADGGDSWRRGNAIDVSEAPNAAVVNLIGDGNIYGNIDINAGDEINVADGTTYFDGIINPEFVPVGGVVEATLDTGLFGEGTLNIGADGNLILADPRITGDPDTYDGPAYAFVETFNMDPAGTITFELQPAEGGIQPVGTYPQIFTNVANLDGTLVADVTPAGGLFSNEGYFWDNVIDAVTRNGEFDQCVLAGAYADSPLLTGAFDGDICDYDDANNVDLGVVRIAFNEVGGLNINQLAAAGGLECLYEDLDAEGLAALAGTGLGEAIAELFLFDGAGYAGALQQLAGAGYAGYLQSFNSLGYHYNQILARATDCEIPALAGSALACRVAPMHLWGQVDYDTLSQDGDVELGDYDADRWSFLIGGDISVTPAAVVGVSVGKVTNKVDYDGLEGRVKGDGWQFGAYGTYDPGQFYVKALGTYTKMDGDGDRGIDFTDFGGTIAGNIEGDADVRMWTFGLHGGYRIPMGPSSVITPFLNYDYTNAKLKGFTETGDTGVELTVNGGREKHSWLTGGVKWAGQMGGLVPEASIGYRHMFGDRRASFNANFAGFEEDCDFDIVSMTEKRGSVLAGLSVGGLLGMVDVRVGYNGAFNSDMQEHSGFLKLVLPLGAVAAPPPPVVIAPPPPPPAPATQTCPDGSVILATDVCPAPPPPPPPPAPAPERG